MTMTAGCLPLSFDGVARYPDPSPTADLNVTIGLASIEEARTSRAIPKLILRMTGTILQLTPGRAMRMVASKRDDRGDPCPVACYRCTTIRRCTAAATGNRSPATDANLSGPGIQSVQHRLGAPDVPGRRRTARAWSRRDDRQPGRLGPRAKGDRARRTLSLAAPPPSIRSAQHVRDAPADRGVEAGGDSRPQRHCARGHSC